MPGKNAFYAQSGGVTAVINATACGVIETARKHRAQIGTVYAGRNGIIGALREDLIDTSKESAAAIRGLLTTPAGAFGSCRHKLKSLEENRAEYERLIEVFKAHNIGYFFYNGGGDSADTCLKVSQLSQATGYPLQAIHVPKTIDNDLPLTDNCPGFRLGRQVHRHLHQGSGHGCGLHVRDLDQGIHPRSHGTSRGLDSRSRQAWPRRRKGTHRTLSCSRRSPLSARNSWPGYSAR